VIKSRDSVHKIFREMYINLIDCSINSNSGSELTSSEQVEWGAIRKKFAKQLKDKFEAEFGEMCCRLSKLGEQEIKTKLNKLTSEMAAFKSDEGNLGDYSPWLRGFKRNVSNELEIPGNLITKSSGILSI
jgi:hypothetical protein